MTLRTLMLAGTAGLLLAGNALAQDAQTGATGQEQGGTEQSAGAAAPAETDATVTNASEYLQANDDQVLASDFIGETVYSSDQPNAEKVGQIVDVVLTPDGSRQAVVVEVGDYIGAENRYVAIDFSRLQQNNAGDRQDRIAFEISPEDLKQAPAYNLAQVQRKPPTGQGQAPNGLRSDQSAAAGGSGAGGGSDQPAGASQDQAPRTAAQNQNATDQGQEQGENAVNITDLRTEDLIGARVYGANQEEIGEVGDVLVEPEGGITAYIVDVGGFLGIGEKEVAMSAENLEIRREGDNELAVYTEFTEEQINDQATYDESVYQEDPDSVLLR